MTEEEIELVHQRMSNGENVMFGDSVTPSGLPENSYLSKTVSENEINRWKSSNTYPMHQWLVSRAITILGNDYPYVKNFYSSTQQAIIKEAADWPDSNEDNLWFFNCHFYYYPNATNYLWQSSPTAKSKFIDWYNSAVAKYRAGNVTQALKELGYAIHYLSDLGAPPHTGDRSINPAVIIVSPSLFAIYDGVQAGKHSDYETDAYNVRDSYAVSNSNYYSWYTANAVDYIAEVNASITYTYYAYAYSPNSTDRQNAIKYPVQYTQQNVAGLLYKFQKDVTGWQYVDGYWRYIDPSNGQAVTGWQYLYDAGSWDWYFFDTNGRMQMGWNYLYDGGYSSWYYFSTTVPRGKLLIGWQYLEYNGVYNWYYFSTTIPRGKMQIGWQYLSYNGESNWYYFRTADGVPSTGAAGSMCTGWQTIGGVQYYFNSSGAWVS